MRDSVVHQSLTPNTVYVYDAANNLKSVTLPNGVVTSYFYDALNRLTHEQTMLGTTVQADYLYTLLPNGQRSQVIESGTILGARKITWTYDNIGRLTSETYDAGNNGSGTGEFAHRYIGRLKSSRTTTSNTMLQL